MQDHLFQSTISVRSQPTATGPHLGLYIVRLFAEFHPAQVSARNRDDAAGVEIRIEFPRTASFA
jgi:signal transduction histidine kinase